MGPVAVSTIANIVIALIALLHVYVLVLEMFLWDKPAGLRAFGQTQEAASASKGFLPASGRYGVRGATAGLAMQHLI